MNRNIHRKTPLLESLFNKFAGLQTWTLLKIDSNIGAFLWIMQNFKNSFFIALFIFVNVQKQPTEMLYKTKKILNWMKWSKYNHVLYLFISFCYYYICILSRSSRGEVFLKTVFLKISQNWQENTCTGVSFLSATSNFVNEETPAHCFPKPLTILAKSPIANSDWLLYTPLYYLLAKVHRMSTKRSTKS